MASRKFYPLADRLSTADRRKLKLPLGLVLPPSAVHAVFTGQKRPPRAGEWYLSGAIVEAYRAPSNFTTSYHIARLVKTRTVVTTEIVETP